MRETKAVQAERVPVVAVMAVAMAVGGVSVMALERAVVTTAPMEAKMGASSDHPR